MKKIFILFSIFFFNYSTFATQSVTAKHGMVVSENDLASQIGVDILRAGGNAIDAAVAVGYALSVVDPCCGNIGGGGFMTLHLANGKNIFLNFREKAPLKATKNMFLTAHGKSIEDASTQGYLAVATPGTVLGLETALQRYGSLSRKQVMAPAIQLATRGVLMTSYEAKRYRLFATKFSKQANVAAIFLKNGRAYQAGERLIQADLAHTLQKISDQGAAVFYKGSIAQDIVKASQSHGGILTLADFAKYTVQELNPVRCNYRGYTLISAPPPSSGGVTLCEILNILENFPLNPLAYRSAENTRLIVEAMRYGFADRNKKLGDPDFINNPLAQLLSKKYAKKFSAMIQYTVTPPEKLSATQHELTDTTHYSIIDNKGNAVAVTYTLNGFFGAGVIAGKTGFFLNDEMDDFATISGKENKFGLVQYDANSIQPGKRPLSSMAPTLVMKNGKIFMVLGSPGGPRIITAVLLTLLNIIDYGMTIEEAVNAPRFHYQGQPNSIDMEPLAFSFMTSIQLKRMGYYLTPQNTWAAVEAILIDPTTGIYTGANDHRRPDGNSIGY